ARANIREGIVPALMERELGLQQKLAATAERQARLLITEATETQAITLKQETEKLLTQYEEVETEIRASSPRYASLMQPQPLSANAIQQQVLDADTLLLEFALGDERSYVWAVTADRKSTRLNSSHDQISY